MSIRQKEKFNNSVIANGPQWIFF